jgi:lupus La protein
MTDIENTVSDAANVGSNTQEAVNVEKIVDAQNVSDNATDKPVNDTNGSASEKADDAQPTKAEDEPENSNGTETAATLQPETTREPERSAEVNEENKGSTAVKKSACPTNVKFDATLLPESSDPAEIRKQVQPLSTPPHIFSFSSTSSPDPLTSFSCKVEFYFSDSNLPYDKFLWSLVTKENKPVPIKLICSFKRMRRFKDHTTVVSALKESEMLEIGNEDESGDENIKRKIALAVVPTVDNNQTEIRQIFDKAQSRSMYAVRNIIHLIHFFFMCTHSCIERVW